ncbi:MAG: glycosyltransferase family 9 protein [Cytophagaceae bacterium]|nr:glycosyltransferase family 9 protein [Cytophagaceae bacterium]
MHILLSRTDRIGDVMLTLPLAGALKTRLPHPVRITFLGASYTRDVVACCQYVDDFVAWDETENDLVPALKALRADVILHVFPVKEIAFAALRANIPLRVGTRNRVFHWLTCNRLLALSRKNSDLHESQLNLKFLETFGLENSFDLPEIHSFYGFRPRESLLPGWQNQLDPARCNIIFHPKSKGSAREWRIENFIRLAELLPPETFRIFVTGTAQEAAACGPLLTRGFPHVRDLTGQLSLAQLIAFIDAADGLVANSTGPVHLAAALGKLTIGLYPTARPLHPGRWQPIGPRVRVFSRPGPCAGCPATGGCSCINSIRPEAIAEQVQTAIRPA